MRIGSDFDKIEWEFLGMNLLEPNALIGDLLLCFIAIMFFTLIRKETSNLFVRYWSRFYLTFAISFVIGGFGHVLFNYTHIAGRIPPWYLGIITSFWIEQSMGCIKMCFSMYGNFHSLLIFLVFMRCCP